MSGSKFINLIMYAIYEQYKKKNPTKLTRAISYVLFGKKIYYVQSGWGLMRTNKFYVDFLINKFSKMF